MPQFDKRSRLAVVARVCRAAGGCQLYGAGETWTVRKVTREDSVELKFVSIKILRSTSLSSAFFKNAMLVDECFKLPIGRFAIPGGTAWLII
jgi:hypothetical protein